MYNAELITGPRSTVSISTGGATTEVDLYSRRGLETVAGLWLKLSAEYKLMYGLTWLGVPIIQLPGDIVMMQELIWKLRPDFIVECGFAHGGSAIFYASILELIGKGEVIGIDVEVRSYNRAAVRSHPLSKRVHILEGSSVDRPVADRVESIVRGSRCVLVVLDSNHGSGHVFREMEMYQGLVTESSYLVVMDGAQAHVWDTPGGKEEWRTSNPIQAIDRFLAAHPEFEEDPHYTRVEVTSSPRGFLRRLRPRELPRTFELEALVE